MSFPGLIATTQQMLDFCAQLARNDVRYRFVLDMTQLPEPAGRLS